MSRNPLFSRHMAGIVSVILLTFFLFSFTTATAAPLATTIVSPATPNGWIWGLESGTNGSVAFVSGPATPPAGTGSARFQTGNNTTGVVLSRNGIYPGLRFDDITTLTYDLYKASGSSATNDAIFQVNVDYNLTDANTAWQGRLVYEPYYFSSLPTDTWTSLDPLTDGAGWWATGAPGNGVCPISNPCTWTEVLTAFPNAGVQTGTLAAIHFKAGAGWTTPFDGNVDNLHIMADGGIDDTYDFDNSSAGPGPACTTICYVSPLGSDTNGGASANDPLRNIQTGITNVSAGGTVMVAAGTYFEALTVNKWLTLDGAGSGTNAAVDTLIIPPSTTSTALNVSVGGNSASDRSLFRDFRVTRAVAPTGLATETGTGISLPGVSYLAFNNVASIWNGAYGVSVSGTGVDHIFDSVTLSGNYSSGWRSSSTTSINGVTFEDSLITASGQIGLATGGGVNSANHNNFVLRNTIFDGNGTRSFAGTGLGFGDISFFKFNGNLTIEDVTVLGMPVNGPHIGVQIRGSDGAGGSPPLGPSGTVIIDNLDISGNYRRPSGAASNPGGPGNALRIQDYGAGSSISFNDLTINSGSQTIGLAVLGQSTTYDLGNTDFTGSLAVIAIEGSGANTTGSSNLTATGITVNGVAAGTATLSQLFAIEDLIYHRIDSGTPINVNQAIGLVRVRANNVYVTVNSFLAPFTTTPSIQRGIAAASVGDTVNVGAGTFNEAVTIDKSLTLDGVGAGTNPAIHTLLDGNTPSAQTGNGITLNGGITNVTIQELRVQDYGGAAPGGSGIFGTLSNHNTIVRRTELVNNNLSNAANGGGLYMNGPVNNVTIDDNDAINNRSRGIVIWNGLKTNIAITNNYVANNICCGIELQDGTASGVTVTGNTVENNGDSGMAFIGLRGPGANLIANNTVTNNGRFGIEIKLPDGNGTLSGGGSIVVEDNTVSRSSVPADARDLAGISVYRRGWVAGNGNLDIPTGVIVRDNTVGGYQQTTTSDGFGIVVEGVNHQVTNNTLNNNDVGVQVQGGHLPYTPNTNIDGDQANLNDQFFGRGNAPLGCAAVSGNVFSGNTTNTRSVGNGGAGIRATNTTTLETFCTIQAAIDDANTIAGHTIEVAAGTFEEQVEVNKAITLEGQGAGVTTIVAPLDMPDFFNSGADNNYPIIYVHDVNATIRDLTVDGDGRGNLNYRFFGVAFEQAGGTLENVTVTGITETPFNGNQHGNGIWGRANNGTARTLTVTDVTITDFQKNGTVFTGANLTVTMDDSTVVGSSPLGLGFPAQNGIQLSGGATGSFDNNDISDIVYTPATFAATGYLISDASGTVNVTNSDITNTTTAIYYINTQGNLTDNTIVNTPAGMGSAVYWWGAIVYNTTAAPLIAEGKPALPDAVDTGDEATVPEGALLNRSYTIEGNTFMGGGGGDGLSVYADAPEVATVTINENSVDDWAVGVYLDGAGTLNANVTANSVTNSDVGIQSERGTVNITNNVINNNGTGVLVSGAGTIAPTLYQNSIVSTGLGVNKIAAGIALVNASANWWGTNTPAGVAGEVSAGVDYTPWFDVGTDTNGAAGWQGDFSWFNADDNSPQTGAVGRINEAITLVTVSGTVNLVAGTYNETASVPKSLTLQGAGAGTNPNLHTILEGTAPADTVGNGITLAPSVANVTIQELRIQNYDLDGGFVAGIYGSGDNSNITIDGVHLYGNNRGAPLTSQGGGVHFANGTAGPSDITITNSEAVTNTGRGFTLWIGVRENVTITNNLVNDNSIVGIDLSGGTSEGVRITDNTVTESGDSGIAVSGLQGGSGANLIADNIVTNNGRFGIEIKMPNGNGTDTGDGSIVIEDNTVTLATPIAPTEQRDLAGIAVFRRDYVAGNANIPTGVIVRNNTVTGYQQTTVSEGFGIVVEGVNHQVTTNTLNNNEVGVQVQGGHLPYTPNSPINGDQSNLADQFFGRGNAPLGCAAVSGNIFSGNTTNTRSVGNAGDSIRATNSNTLEQFCTIQAAIDDADTANTHTINIAAGTWEEQVEVYKDLTLQGAGTLATTIVSPVTLTDFFTSPGNNNYPVVLVRNTNNVTIRDLTVDGSGRGNSNYRFTGVAFENVNGTIENVRILDIRNTPIDGAQHGIALWGRAQSGTPRTLNVNNVTVDGFQKNGTAFSGVNLTVAMNNSTVTGEGAINFTAQNGIQLSGGATGSFDNNSVTGFTYTPYTFVSTGYLLFGAGGTVNITNGDINDSMVGAYYYNTQGNVTDNTFLNTPAGMGSAPYWFGVILENDIAAPFTANGQTLTPSPYDAGDGEGESLLLNRSYLVQDNTFTGGGNGAGVAVYARAAEVATVTIQENDVTDWETGIYLSATQTLNSDVLANNITLSDIGIQTEGGNDVDINNNVIDNNGTGVFVSNGTVSPTIFENTITNTGLGVNKTAAGIPVVDASANSWGSNVPATVAGEVSAGVDYTPWFAVGTDNAPAAGWQGDFSTLHADDNSPQTGSAGRVQEAVTLVSPNGLVYAEAGTYEETVSINGKDLTVQGRGEGISTILSTTSVPSCWAADRHPIICIQNTGNVTFRDLTVDGDGRGNGDAIFYGIAYRNAGGTVEDVTIVDVAETPMNGVQSGVALYACADNGTARTLTVDEVALTGFQKNGTAFNCANLTVTMSDSVVTGAGPINFNAQNGIQLAFGANGSFTNNTISNVGYTPTSDNGTGYLLYQASGTTSITGSDLEDVEVGAYAYDSAMTFNGNVITQTTAGMSGMPTWFGVFIASDVPAPLAPNATVQPVEDGNVGGSANAVMNRTHTLNGNTMTSEGRVGTAIGTDVDAPEVTTLNILTNTLSTWDVGIEFDGDGLLAATVDDSYISDNTVGVVIRTGVMNITNNDITLNNVGIRYFDSDGVEPEVHLNELDFNTIWAIEHAVFNTQANPTIVDATSNYWGNPTGPLDTHLPGDAPCTSLVEYNPLSTGNPVTECVRWFVPLSVMLANFEAIARANDILVTWETASETDNLGFNLYRATTPDGTLEQLNGELIPSQAPGGSGALYEWEDVNVEVGVTYFYWLEAVDIQGNGSPYFGPVSATYGAPTAVTLSDLNAQPATLPMLLAAGLLIFGAVGMVMVRRRP